MAEKLLNKNLADLMKDASLSNKVEILQKQGTNRNYLDINLVKPNPFQPRKNFDEKALKELASSIKEYGVFSPILVRPRENFYEIVAGERRYRASLLAEMDTIPAIIENFTDQEMTEIALLENIQRENLNPLEISQALYKYQTTFNCTQEELAAKFGKSRPYVANILRLRQLPQSVQDEVINGNISAGHARTLVGLNSIEAEKYMKMIKDKNLSVRQTETLIAKVKESKNESKQKAKENEIGSKLKAKVKLSSNEIKISFSSKEELEAYLKNLLN